MRPVRVTPKGARALRAGSPWCYRTEVVEAPSGAGPGEIVLVQDVQGNPIGQAFWATRSKLPIRLLTRHSGAGSEGPDETIDRAFFKRRLELALARRKPYAGRDAMRLVHGEADLLPGLFVDRYGDALVLQTLSEGADVRKPLFTELLLELTSAQCIVARDDGSGRDFEGLPREVKQLHGEGSTVFRYHEGENLFEVDLLADMKTGSFLDQLDNHLRAGELASGEALDCFSYHGGFALSLARRAHTVLAIEQDPTAAEKARQNAARNGRTNVTVESANAFDILKNFDKAGRRFDTVVMDPPGFVKRKEGLSAALRAYHELNLRSLRILRPEGILVTCSCSGKLSREAFEEMVLGAARDAKRTVQILERRGAGLDHPGLAGLAESEYLKALFLRVL